MTRASVMPVSSLLRSMGSLRSPRGHRWALSRSPGGCFAPPRLPRSNAPSRSLSLQPEPALTMARSSASPCIAGGRWREPAWPDRRQRGTARVGEER